MIRHGILPIGGAALMVALLVGQIVEQTVRPYTWFPWVIVIWVALAAPARCGWERTGRANSSCGAGRERGTDVSIALPADVGLGGVLLGSGVLDRVAETVAELGGGEVALLADDVQMAGPNGEVKQTVAAALEHVRRVTLARPRRRRRGDARPRDRGRRPAPRCCSASARGRSPTSARS